jgi:hypothetical protein
VRLLIGGHLKDREAVLERADATEQMTARILDTNSEFEASLQSFLHHIYPRRMDTPTQPVHPALRQNYRWDCMVARADALLFRAVLQMLSGGSEIKGAFNLRKSWKLYTKLLADTDLDENTCLQRVSERPKSVRSSWYSNIGSFGGSTPAGEQVDLDPDVCDAIVCGIGIFYFVLSIIPNSFLSVLKAICCCNIAFPLSFIATRPSSTI